ncbi:MAG: acyltransferase [Alistipes sp.]|nr:acyltransferase [Alistipes sp.]
MKTQTLSSGNFTDAKPHYELLDGLRGVAAVIVVLYHIFEGYAYAGGGLITTVNHGHLSVDFFFILSGFVISYAYDDRWKTMTLGNFFKRRLIRLHPMVIMGVLIGVATFLIGGRQQWNGTVMPFGSIMIAMLLTMLMIPATPGTHYELRGNGEMFPINGPMWSLFFEYIGNILYALIIRRLSTKLLAVLAVALGAIHAWVFVTDMSGYGMMGVGWTLNSINFWSGLVRMLFPFTVGMLLARTFKPRKVKGAFWLCSAILVAVAAMPFIAAQSSINMNCLYEVLCVMFVLPAVVWLGACGNADKSFTGRVSSFLGQLSYPLYLVHYPIMYLFYAWLIENQRYTFRETMGVTALAMLTSVVIAYACLKLYDEPVRKWLARKFIK